MVLLLAPLSNHKTHKNRKTHVPSTKRLTPSTGPFPVCNGLDHHLLPSLPSLPPTEPPVQHHWRQQILRRERVDPLLRLSELHFHLPTDNSPEIGRPKLCGGQLFVDLSGVITPPPLNMEPDRAGGPERLCCLVLGLLIGNWRKDSAKRPRLAAHVCELAPGEAHEGRAQRF